jgi:large subunit ribosomal protein L23
MPGLYDIIKRPIITEKGLSGVENGKYVFEVHTEANKNQVREAVETLFTNAGDGAALQVVAVNTFIVKGRTKRFRSGRTFKMGKTPNYKKAVVTLAQGQAIQLFEGV